MNYIKLISPNDWCKNIKLVLSGFKAASTLNFLILVEIRTWHWRHAVPFQGERIFYPSPRWTASCPDHASAHSTSSKSVVRIRTRLDPHCLGPLDLVLRLLHKTPPLWNLPDTSSRWNRIRVYLESNFFSFGSVFSLDIRSESFS